MRSHIQALNESGPKVEPLSTPNNIPAQQLKIEFILVRYFLTESYV